ncbi:MAG: phosphate ABC transporter permease PtsA [Acidobacteria bacterium]|nr:MAG: phosphate ABC transporter permease PtsA [Acidobacteriota bacterium]REJ99303.1 MAG: phosphate ABC transporter permease PtsA [Acidobacteriota bacterium]REK15977.1 MAG: phosphate ABC transporter permease PtsA [Acidobacteriota bacterium]REK43658.1 MAG: phosphate ABC transporter permease PtsA [Acidobacteriota bacterium]
MMDRNTHSRRKLVSGAMTLITAACAIAAIIVLVLILTYIAAKGLTTINYEFLTDTPKPVGEGGGIGNAIMGSALMTLLATAIGLPIGIGAGVYLAEFGENIFGNTVRFLADTLIGVPSIIVGIFIYTLIVLPMGRQSGLAGALSLAIIMIPIVARTTEEMIRLVPQSMREGALALGAPQWRVTWNIVMPAAASGIATGAMLSIARISGETAPLLFTALNSRFYNYFFDQPMASLTVQIYNYATGPFEIEHQMAWAATLILVGLILVINVLVRFLTKKKY